MHMIAVFKPLPYLALRNSLSFSYLVCQIPTDQCEGTRCVSCRFYEKITFPNTNYYSVCLDKQIFTIHTCIMFMCMWFLYPQLLTFTDTCIYVLEDNDLTRDSLHGSIHNDVL